MVRMLSVVAVLATASTGFGAIVEVAVHGVVEFNQINGGVLGNVNAGDAATLTFQVDSDNFINSPSFPTRGYEIDQSSFLLDFGASGQIGLQDPFPGGETPFFVLRDNDPAVDGFFISNSVDFPIGVPLDQTGLFDQFGNNFSVTYTPDTLDSLDILDAHGTYDFSGLTVFNWSITDGPFEPMFIVFDHMTITVIPAPAAIALFAPLLTGHRRRRSN